MNILIIEDESQTAQRLVNLIRRYNSAIEVIGTIPSVKKTLEYFSSPSAILPDLIFLDIHLEDDLGFRILEELDLTIPVIFTTAHNEYTLKAFKNFTIDYLLKPIDYEELCGALDKYKKIAGHVLTQNPNLQITHTTAETPYRERFMVSIGTRIQSVEVQQIAYFSYEQKASFLTTKDGKHFAVDYSLDRIMQQLDPHQFFRINRSFIASFSAIHSINAYAAGKLKVDLQPKASEEIFVSSDRVTAFKTWLGK